MSQSESSLSYSGKLPALFGLSIAYIVSGKLGLLLALPPGYASAIFPPAGIGVVALLVYGRKALPWIFISALLLNLWIGFDNGARLGWLPVLIAILIAVASSLQAIFGSYLLKKYLGYPLLLGSMRELVRFGLSAPVICLVSASLSIASLAGLGVVPLNNAGIHWLTWWLGDTLGVLLITPLLMVAIGEPKSVWRSRIFSVALPMAIMLTLLISTFAFVNQWERKQNFIEFDTIAREKFEDLKLRFELQESLLEQTQALFSLPAAKGVHQLSREQFRHYAEAAQKNFTAVQAISWVPRVYQSEREAFEKFQRREFPDFEIRERDSAGKLKRADIRKYYQTVTYIEPLKGNEAALGFDLASNPARHEALAKADKLSEVVATAPIRLVQEKQEQSGILLIKKVHEGPRKSDVVTIVLRMGDFMSQIASRAESQIQIRLIDVETKTNLFSTFSENIKRPQIDEEIELGTRKYRFQAEPTAIYIAEHRTWQSWMVLVVGLFTTALLGGFMLLGTGQKAHAEALVEERTRDLNKRKTALANAQQIANVGSWEWNIVTGDLIWSDEIYRIFGLVPQQFSATYAAFLERVHPDDVERVQQAVDRALKGEDKYHVEHRVVRPSGEVRFVEEQGVVERSQAGNTIAMIGVVHDITERKKLDRMKSEFISTVSHELRTPLTSIRGAIGLVVGQFGKSLPENVLQMLKMADRNSERLSMLINDLLDLEKMESGHIDLELAKTDIVALARRSVEDNFAYASKLQVALVLENMPEQAMVMGDSYRLLQVFANLISNAVKFSNPNGRIEVSIDSLPGIYRVSVRDHGAGIPEEFRGRIFGRFAQADSSDSRQKGGTGLGLSITKVIVESHKGRIGYDATPGGGATFWFELPALAART